MPQQPARGLDFVVAPSVLKEIDNLLGIDGLRVVSQEIAGVSPWIGGRWLLAEVVPVD